MRREVAFAYKLTLGGVSEWKDRTVTVLKCVFTCRGSFVMAPLKTVRICQCFDNSEDLSMVQVYLRAHLLRKSVVIAFQSLFT